VSIVIYNQYYRIQNQLPEKPVSLTREQMKKTGKMALFFVNRKTSALKIVKESSPFAAETISQNTMTA
jgi:hypothetical protein